MPVARGYPSVESPSPMRTLTGVVMLQARPLLAISVSLTLLAAIAAPPTLAGSTSRSGHGVLEVTTSPSVPASIFVDGIARNTSRVDGLELGVGDHEVAFGSVDGFLSPPSTTITMKEGGKTAIVGDFVPAGELVVTTSPDGLDPLIAVDGDARDRGATTLQVEVGEREICAGDITGYVTPQCETVTVIHGESTKVELAYELANEPVLDGDRVSDGLVSLYDFAEGAGSTVADVFGNIDLTIADPSAVSWTEAGLRFDKATIARSTGAPSRLYDAILASKEFTVEAWITPANTTQNGPARILTLGRNTVSTNLLVGQGAYNGPSTQVETRLHERTGDYKLNTASGTFTDQLTHLTVTRAVDGTVSTYIDGELAAQRKMASSLDGWNTSYQLGLGQELNGERSWLGTYHLVAIYDTALDTTDIATNHTAGPGADIELPGLRPEPEPAPAPEPEAQPVAPSPSRTPASWKNAWDSGNLNSIRSWYQTNTGHEANGYAVSDLTPVGHLVTQRDGQVIDGVLASSIRVSHNDVTIRNSRITSSWNYGISYTNTWGRNIGNTLIEYVTFDGWNGSVGNDNHAAYLAANSDGAVVRRSRVTGYASGISMRSNTTFEESWVRDLWRPASSVSHGTSTTIRGPENAAVRNLLEGPGYSSALSLYADHGGALHNALVEYNVMNDSAPHYQINAPNRKYSAESQNVRVRHNRFGPNARYPSMAGLGNFSHHSNDIRDNRAL